MIWPLRYILLSLLLLSVRLPAAERTEIPLDDRGLWTRIDTVPKGRGSARFTTNGVSLHILEDACSFIHVFTNNVPAVSARVTGHLHGKMKTLPERKPDGRPPDFYLRLGVIEPGKKRLSWLQRKFAPDWIVRMESMIPRSVGLGKITFYSFGNDSARNGEKWRGKHGIREQQVHTLSSDESFDMTIQLPANTEILALWLFADGDATGSRFTIDVNRLVLSSK
jgi:hypothetical protein